MSEEQGGYRITRQLVHLLGIEGHVDKDEDELQEQQDEVHRGVHLLNKGTASREVVHEQARVLHGLNVGHQIGHQARILARLHRRCHSVECQKTSFPN